MNKNITLDTVVLQYKSLKDILDILDYVEQERDKLVEIWGDKKYDAILDTLRAEVFNKEDSMVTNLGKLYKEET